MPSIRHVVQPGECLSRIALHHGFSDYLVVWNDAGNARLRRKRRNPNVLFPGDVVNIPDRKAKTISAGTQTCHTFVVKRPTKELRVAFADGAGKPLGDTDYVLVVDGDRRAGKTDGSGLLRAKLPFHLRTATVEIAGRQLRLELGELNPIGDLADHDATGIQQRLRNLGYDVGPIDGICGVRTRSALRLFQAEHDLPIDGELAAATLDKLIEVHGS